MECKKIYLDTENTEVFLDCYIADSLNGYKRKAMLVIPGGGYGCICSDREGEPIAQAFIAKGYNAFVLHYSVGGRRAFPAQLIEASMAVKHIRDNAENYGIDPKNVFVVGFSAGGHLAGCLATMWQKDDIYAEFKMPFGYNKPAGVMMIYPVVTGVEGCAHKGSFCNLLCTDDPLFSQLEKCSIEKNIGEHTAPIFIVHTSNDEIVNVQNSLLLASALAKHNKTFELHIYPNAPHGVALANEITECGVPEWNNKEIAKWVDQASVWAETLAN